MPFAPVNDTGGALVFLRPTEHPRDNQEHQSALPCGTSVDAASFQTRRSFETEGALELAKRMNQYLSGCRMLQSRYIFGEFHHILVRTAPLARLLHCVVESVACPICIGAVADSRLMGGTADKGSEQRVRQ